MIFMVKFSKRSNCVKNVDRVMVLVHCIFPDDVLYLYQVS